MEGIRCFELLEDLTSDGVARAVLLRWDGQDYVKSHDVIELHDVVSSHGSEGDRGYTFQSGDSGRWEVLAGLYQQVPRFGGM